MSSLKTVTWQRATRAAARDLALVTSASPERKGWRGMRTADVRLARFFPGENFDLEAATD
ncbi:hypothetical protein [Bosea sp. 117]|uniref:hypothetical protein n=1 Tax=Bosea sp. 117 TaxID=1125973 RepID=UPI000494B34F|nr:hypothetical protein [Bosea sp. 117]